MQDRRDFIWIDSNPQVGRELTDTHPMLILSPKSFNEQTGIVIGLPTTTAQHNNTNPFAIEFQEPKNLTRYVRDTNLGRLPGVREAQKHFRKSAYLTMFLRLRVNS